MAFIISHFGMRFNDGGDSSVLLSLKTKRYILNTIVTNRKYTSQLNFRIPPKEKEFPEWWSGQLSEPISLIYRNATLEAFRQWKITVLVNEYRKGSIGFKRFCRLGNLGFEEATLIFQREDIEPPISSVIDKYTDSVRESVDWKKFRKS